MLIHVFINVFNSILLILIIYLSMRGVFIVLSYELKKAEIYQSKLIQKSYIKTNLYIKKTLLDNIRSIYTQNKYIEVNILIVLSKILDRDVN